MNSSTAANSPDHFSSEPADKLPKHQLPDAVSDHEEEDDDEEDHSPLVQMTPALDIDQPSFQTTSATLPLQPEDIPTPISPSSFIDDLEASRPSLRYVSPPTSSEIDNQTSDPTQIPPTSQINHSSENTLNSNISLPSSSLPPTSPHGPASKKPITPSELSNSQLLSGNSASQQLNTSASQSLTDASHPVISQAFLPSSNLSELPDNTQPNVPLVSGHSTSSGVLASAQELPLSAPTSELRSQDIPPAIITAPKPESTSAQLQEVPQSQQSEVHANLTSQSSQQAVPHPQITEPMDSGLLHPTPQSSAPLSGDQELHSNAGSATENILSMTSIDEHTISTSDQALNLIQSETPECTPMQQEMSSTTEPLLTEDVSQHPPAPTSTSGERCQGINEAESRQSALSQSTKLQSDLKLENNDVTAAQNSFPNDSDAQDKSTLPTSITSEPPDQAASGLLSRSASEQAKQSAPNSGAELCAEPLANSDSTDHIMEPSSQLRAEPSSQHGEELSSQLGVEPSSQPGIELSTPLETEPSSQLENEPSSQLGIEPLNQLGVEFSSQVGVALSSQVGVESSSQVGVESSSQLVVEPSSQLEVEPSSKLKEELSSQSGAVSSSQLEVEISSRLRQEPSSHVDVEHTLDSGTDLPGDSQKMPHGEPHTEQVVETANEPGTHLDGDAGAALGSVIADPSIITSHPFASSVEPLEGEKLCEVSKETDGEAAESLVQGADSAEAVEKSSFTNSKVSAIGDDEAANEGIDAQKSSRGAEEVIQKNDGDLTAEHAEYSEGESDVQPGTPPALESEVKESYGVLDGNAELSDSKKKHRHKTRKAVFVSRPRPSTADASANKSTVHVGEGRSVFEAPPRAVVQVHASALRDVNSGNQMNEESMKTVFESKPAPSTCDVGFNSPAPAAPNKSVYTSEIAVSHADAGAHLAPVAVGSKSTIFHSPGRPSMASARAVDPVIEKGQGRSVYQKDPEQSNADARAEVDGNSTREGTVSPSSSRTLFTNAPAVSLASARASEAISGGQVTGQQKSVFEKKAEPSNVAAKWSTPVASKQAQLIYESKPAPSTADAAAGRTMRSSSCSSERSSSCESSTSSEENIVVV